MPLLNTLGGWFATQSPNQMIPLLSKRTQPQAKALLMLGTEWPFKCLDALQCIGTFNHHKWAAAYVNPFWTFLNSGKPKKNIPILLLGVVYLKWNILQVGFLVETESRSVFLPRRRGKTLGIEKGSLPATHKLPTWENRWRREIISWSNLSPSSSVEGPALTNLSVFCFLAGPVFPI